MLLAGCGLVGMQSTLKRRRIGYLRNSEGPGLLEQALVQGLQDWGWVEGQNLSIEWRYADLAPERLPVLAAELVRMPVEVLVAAGSIVIPPAMEATRSIPIVIVTASDPVEAGYVPSLAKPSGNITGPIYTVSDQLTGKKLELLKELLPSMRRAAYVSNPATPGTAASLRAAESAAARLGLQMLFVNVATLADVQPAFDSALQRGVDALMMGATIQTLNNPHVFGDLASRTRLPAIYTDRVFVEAGGLLSYGASAAAAYRRAGAYIDKILKGANPADLPIEQPTVFELLVNIRAAEALGLTFPPSVAALVTEWIQ